MEKFIAHIEFEFEADALRDGGRRLRDLSAVAEPAGFRMIRGEVRPAGMRRARHLSRRGAPSSDAPLPLLLSESLGGTRAATTQAERLRPTS